MELGNMLSQQAVDSFRKNGFLIYQNAFAADVVQVLRERLTFLFKSDLEPIWQRDKWACRSNLTALPGHQYMLNAWKGDHTVARIATDLELGKTAATLCGWPGVRLAGDAVWWKLPGAHPVPFHQDAMAVRTFLNPPDFLTCWIALDDVSEEVGSLEYVPESHTWPIDDSQLTNSQDHREGDYQIHMRAAGNRIGISQPEIISVRGKAGMCTFHHGLLWHGSPANAAGDQLRRAYSVLFIRMDSKFCDVPRSPDFAYYKHPDSDELDERHFPIMWSHGGYRSHFLEVLYPNTRMTETDSILNEWVS